MPEQNGDQRHHVQSGLMRESLVDKEVMASTESPIVRMLPNVHVIKIGGRSIIDQGKVVTYPVIDVLSKLLESERLILGVGGGVRSRHVFSIGIDLGLPTGVLAQISVADALGNAHILGTLLAPYGVVAIPPEIFGHLLPLFIHSAPGVIFNGVPPYSLWEHPPGIGRIPPHRTDAGCLILGECFGCKSVTLVKDVDGLYTEDPKGNPNADFIDSISAAEMKKRKFKSLPFDEVIPDLLLNARLVRQIQIVNGHKPELVAAAVRGEHVGTIIYAD
ncbi:MAG: uridylate kinase [Candidatus Kapaibacterium sp.]